MNDDPHVQNRPAEWSFKARVSHGERPDALEMYAIFTHADGMEYRRPGFWSGGDEWRVRFAPPMPGGYSYRTACSDESDSGLHDRQGAFDVSEYEGDNPLLRHGPVGLSDDRRYLAHADDTPFFWLADTVWNGPLLSEERDWERFLRNRVAKKFSAIQFVMTQYRAARTNAEGELPYTGREEIRINPRFFERMDQRVQAINDVGLLAVPVLLWTLGGAEYSPGQLPEDQAIRLARYMVARYGAHHVVWILGGDGDYRGERAERWRRIGGVVFGEGEHAPVFMHPQGMQWPYDELREEKWLDLVGYQSGHGDDGRTLEWIHSGPPARERHQQPVHPVINLEPPYEDHVAYQSRQRHTAYNVRRAVYWSLLNAPTAGVTYGAHGVWSWAEKPEVPLDHPSTGVARPWHEAMNLPGSEQVKYVADMYMSLPWWRLRPDDALIESQPFGDDPARHVSASRTEDDKSAVVYLPVGTEIKLRREAFTQDMQAEWFDPRTGHRTSADAHDGTFRAPDSQDWVLILRS